MSAEDKLGGYATGFGTLDADLICASVTDDYQLLDKDGVVYAKGDLHGYVADLKQYGDKMEITNVAVADGMAWCQWQIGEIVGAGRISFDANGVHQEQLFYL